MFGSLDFLKGLLESMENHRAVVGEYSDVMMSPVCTLESRCIIW